MDRLYSTQLNVPTVHDAQCLLCPSPVFLTLGTQVFEQMFRSGGQYHVNLLCLVSKQVWYTFIDPLKGSNAESTLPSTGFEPRTCCGVEARYTTTQSPGFDYLH
ncbi:hypothetical protein TNCV_4275951 [Trichonephila clavipes]|nr:hypothetical protein TNCV_4275951 [Trichonephila clavipes]